MANHEPGPSVGSTAPRPIKDRQIQPKAFTQAVVILGMMIVLALVCCSAGAWVAIRIWGH